MALLLASTLAFAPTTLAAGLSLTTPYPSVSVAPGSTVSFEIAIAATPGEQIAVSVSGAPSDWTATLRGGGYVVNGVQADANGAATLRLDVQVPAAAPDGLTRMSVVATGVVRAELPIAVTVTSTAAGSVTMSSDFPSLRGASSSTFTFNLTLHNDTSEDLTFAVTGVGPDGWDVNATLTGQTQAASAVVKAGSTAAISVSAKPPSQGAAGTYPINVRATVGERTIDAQLSVEVTGTNAMTLSTPDQLLSNSGSAGATITQQLVVTNDGTSELQQVVLSTTVPTDWTVTFAPSDTIATIASKATATITASVVPSNDAIAGDYVVTYRAKSGDTNSQVDIRVTIETSPLFGFVGLALIAVVLFGLWWVFRRYGRR